MSEKQYKIKEIFYSIQGEGFHTGTPAVFIRFSGCNLWSGIEQDRKNAICKFCDTDFRNTDGENGGVYSKNTLLAKIMEITKPGNCKFLIFTGGEPLLQVDEELVNFLKSEAYYIAIETNGTREAPGKIDWITVSPKYGTGLVQLSGNELKLVFPQQGFNPESFESYNFSHFFLQPKHDQNLNSNILEAVQFCLIHPKWKLSLQTHKYIGIK
ncbi:MAG: 7-carboxy-7-deazaguanine synthase [Deltaproteobacteria bacterium]